MFDLNSENKLNMDGSVVSVSGEGTRLTSVSPVRDQSSGAHAFFGKW